MDFDPTQYLKLLAAVLLIPGLLFLFVVVFYVAFIGRASSAKGAAQDVTRTCLRCGQTLLPDQNECPTCMPEVIPPVAPHAGPGASSDGEAEVEMEAAPFEVDSDELASPPIDSSSAYEGEIVDDTEHPRSNP
jgi:hypothetical protein